VHCRPLAQARVPLAGKRGRRVSTGMVPGASGHAGTHAATRKGRCFDLEPEAPRWQPDAGRDSEWPPGRRGPERHQPAVPSGRFVQSPRAAGAARRQGRRTPPGCALQVSDRAASAGLGRTGRPAQRLGGWVETGPVRVGVNIGTRRCPIMSNFNLKLSHHTEGTMNNKMRAA
jgi:hypothetical protein